MVPEHERFTSSADAARYLGIGERQLRRYVGLGYLRPHHPPKKPGEKAATTLYSWADLDAIKAGTPNKYEVEPGIRAGVPGPATARELALTAPEAKPARVDLGPDLARLFGVFAQPVGPRFIGIEEFVQLSGLSASRVKTLAPLWAKRGDAIRARGGWKIRRAALDAPLPTPSE